MVWLLKDKFRAVSNVYILDFTGVLRVNNASWIIRENKFYFTF